ncbi:MAG: cytochrome c biogenesis protein CcsA [Chitinophagaceae bacterium]
MQTQYIGEHLLPGQWGHLLVVLSFVASLLSMFAYFSAARTESKDPVASQRWISLARNSFIIHTASIIAIFITLYYIITHHLFEYHYAYAHSDKSLPSKYLLSCFWEGQQGSFLLWSFWHSMLGIVVMFSAKGLESRTMTVIALVQACLATTVLGIYLPGDIQIGTSPFLLLRHQMQAAPIFQQANYLSLIQDGNGLNVLLQNYWMVIHPPVLFLGFASTLIPFAFAIAALWKGEYESFVKPTLTWSLFSGAVLGTGIMMGGAWAYESLNFGGYWAWDPVENASLVPWLIMVAALHTVLVYRSTGRSLKITFLFYILCYVAIWYSTFLTRTGVLGDTSVHAFTGEGKSLYWQLLIFIALIGLPGFILLIRRSKTIPTVKTEEQLWTREFWMFIGSFLLLLSSIQISISTSIPIWAPLAKKITGKDIAPPVDPVAHYNNIQIWVAILIALLCGGVLYLKYRQTQLSKIAGRMGVVALVAAVLTTVIAWGMQISGWQFIVLLSTTCFCLTATVFYAFGMQKSFRKMGPSLSHFGFAVLLLGILITGRRKEIISLNTLGSFLPLGKRATHRHVGPGRRDRNKQDDHEGLFQPRRPSAAAG